MSIPVKVGLFMWNFGRGLFDKIRETKERELKDFTNKITAADGSIERSNERLLAEECHPIEDHVSERGLGKMCRKLKKSQLHQAQAIAELNRTPSSTRICIEILKMGIALYIKAGPEGLAGGALNIICARYL